jgi:phosphoglycolate phosphatase-like HAD superfamily hydrolase
VRGSEAVVVGDGDYDVVLGRAIGAKTVRVRSSDTPPTPGTEADIDVESLHELIGHS